MERRWTGRLQLERELHGHRVWRHIVRGRDGILDIDSTPLWHYVKLARLHKEAVPHQPRGDGLFRALTTGLYPAPLPYPKIKAIRQPSPIWDIILRHLHGPLNARAVAERRHRQLAEIVDSQLQGGLAPDAGSGVIRKLAKRKTN